MNENLFMFNLGVVLADLKQSPLKEIQAQAVADLSYAHKLGYAASMQAFLSWLVPLEDVENEFENDDDKAYALFIREIWNLVGGKEE